MTAKDILTSGDIARELNEPVQAVRYAIERARLKPVARAGIVRLFNRAALDAVREELKSIHRRSIPNSETVAA